MESGESNGDGDAVDELTLMWQSAPRRRGDDGAGTENWFGFSAEESPVPADLPTSADPPTPDDPTLPAEPPTAAVPDPAEESPPLERLEAQICSLAGQLAASTRDWLVLIAEFDRRKGWAQWGVKSCAHWLSWACSVAPGAAREYVRVAAALATLPLLDDAFGAGRLSYSKMRALTRAAGRVDERTLLEQGLVHTASQLERVVRGYRKVNGAGLDQQRRRRARWFYGEDGMLILTARLPADEGALVVAALEQARQSVYLATSSAKPDKPETDGPSADEFDREHPEGLAAVHAADALVAMAQNALAAGPVDSSGDDQHLLVLHADVDVFRGEDVGARCHLDDGPGVDVRTAERMGCDAATVMVARSAVPGEELRLGRKTRKISPALRRALRIRDEKCQHPGCSRRRHLQAHHVVSWMHGGPTDLDNLVLLCRHHHMLLHEAGFTISRSISTRGWVFRRADDVRLANSPLLTADSAADPVADFRADSPADGSLADPERIRPGWRGERFSLADSVSVMCRAERQAEPAVSSRTG